MARKHCVGIVVKDRWDLTQKTLQSLYHTDQLKDSYDLFIIDNGSDPVVSNDLKEWIHSAIVPVKNLIKTQGLPISAAWNLFMALATEYSYRTKLDNDLIFANTPIAAKPYERTTGISHHNTPGDVGTNPGAPRVAAFITGAGAKINNKAHRHHTCFLQHIEDTIRESNLGICAIPPISVGVPMVNAMPSIGNKKWRNAPILMGGCMGMPKNTFDRLGYFDENLPCHIDWEYAQRAMGAGMNVGYTPEYCVIHLGEANPTCAASVIQQQNLQADMIGSQIPFKRDFVHSKWEKVISRIQRAASNNLVVNLT